MVAENGCALGARGSALQETTKTGAVEDVVAQDESDLVGAHEIAADHKGLSEAIGHGLPRVAEVHAPLRAIRQELGKERLVFGRSDNQHITDAGQHERGEWIV